MLTDLIGLNRYGTSWITINILRFQQLCSSFSPSSSGLHSQISGPITSHLLPTLSHGSSSPSLSFYVLSISSTLQQGGGWLARWLVSFLPESSQSGSEISSSVTNSTRSTTLSTTSDSSTAPTTKVGRTTCNPSVRQTKLGQQPFSLPCLLSSVSDNRFVVTSTLMDSREFCFLDFAQSLALIIVSFFARLHLLNAGKYSATIVYFFFYFNWRIDMTRSGSSDDWRFALFIVFATINSVYVASWGQPKLSLSVFLPLGL